MIVKWVVGKIFKSGWKSMFGEEPTLPDNAPLIDTIPNEAKKYGIHINPNWWDSFIDGLNRLPRPIITFGIIFLFALAFYDPIKFVDMVEVLGLIPEPLWYVFYVVVGFWFTTKMIEKAPIGINYKKWQTQFRAMEQLRKTREETQLKNINTKEE